MAGSKILVVYYSRTGTTRKVAESLTTALRCDSEEIVEVGSRSGMLGYVRSLIEARRQVPSRIAAVAKDPSDYDLIVVGTPVWAWSLSSPVRAFLLANRPRLPAVAFFCTLGGAGSDRAFGEMQELTGEPPVGCLAIAAREVALTAYQARVATFAEALQRGLAERRKRAPTAA